MIELDSILQQEGPSEEITRAAVYARTSSINQRFGRSLEEQVRLCVERCRLLGWEVIFVFRDEAESGKDTERPMFQAMLQAAKYEQFDVVLFWKLDRISRTLLHAVQIEAELRENNVALYSLTEQIDTTTSAGRFNFRNLANAAEFERDMIKERSEMGVKARALEGRWPNKNAPFGYILLNDGRLEVHPYEAAVVRWIFHRYLTRKSMPAIADELNNRTLKFGRCRKWNAHTVRKILTNKLYLGHFNVSGVSKMIPEYRILEDSLFEEVTNTRLRFQRKEGKRPKMASDRRDSLIDGIMNKYRDFL